jgi:Lrp/AsnC family leucine-responsive transcriptional regulator
MKRLANGNGSFDPIDTAILSALSRDGRTSVADLARATGLSAPSIAERVRRLEENGIIVGYAAKLDPAALGFPLSAWLRIRPIPGKLHKVVEILDGIDQIVECDRVTGEDCFIARAYARSVEDLEWIIDRIIPFAMTNTAIIQSSPIGRRLPPLNRPAVLRRKGKERAAQRKGAGNRVAARPADR